MEDIRLTEVANGAFDLIGVAIVNSLYDNNAQARWMLRNIGKIVRKVQSLKDWEELTERIALTPETYTKTITGATAANPVVITSVAHGLSNGDKVVITDVVGMTELNGKTFIVANKTDDTFELYDEDGSSYTAYSSAGTITKCLPNHGWNYQYDLPEDCLRVTGCYGLDANEWEVEQNKLFCNYDTVDISYLKYDLSPDNWDDELRLLIEARLAAECALPLTKKTKVSEEMWTLYKDKEIRSMAVDAMENGVSPMDDEAWISERAW